MRLLNFELDGEVSAIVLRGLGLEWDLHNFAKFTGLTLDVSSDSLLLKWSVPPATNPWDVGRTMRLLVGCYSAESA
jgi:hypothetical protein